MQVIVFLEHSGYDTNILVTQSKMPMATILKKFGFRSSRSLRGFLEEYGSVILEKIPSSDEILEQIERSGLPEAISGVRSDTTPAWELLEDILDAGIKYQAITENDICDYITAEDADYIYEIQRTILQ